MKDFELNKSKTPRFLIMQVLLESENPCFYQLFIQILTCIVHHWFFFKFFKGKMLHHLKKKVFLSQTVRNRMRKVRELAVADVFGKRTNDFAK